MKAHARVRFLRHSPPKVRRVLDLVRGLPVTEARDVLTHTNLAATTPVRKVLDAAVANAEHNYSLVADELEIVEAFADGGPIYRRFKARARGRVGRIERKTSNMTIVVGDGLDNDDDEVIE